MLFIYSDWDLSKHLKSKTGKSLYFVYGMTAQVKEFDRHHVLFKDFRYKKSADICQNLLIGFKKGMKEKSEEAKLIYCRWEKEFFAKNLIEPKIEDMDGEMYKIYKQYLHSKTLIKSWALV